MEAAALGRNERVNPPLPSDTTHPSIPPFHPMERGMGGGGFIVAIIRCLNGNELLLGTQGYNGIVDATETPSESFISYIVNQTQCVPVGIERLENK